MVGSDSILPTLDSESGGYESLYSSASMVEVYMANSNVCTAAIDAVTQEMVDALLQNPIEGDPFMAKATEATHVAILAKQQHLDKERESLEVRDRELQSAMAREVRQARRRPSSLAAQKGHELRDSATSRGTGSMRIHPTPAKNLLAAAALANSLVLPTGGPEAKNHI